MSDLDFWKRARRRAQVRVANAPLGRRAKELDHYMAIDALVQALERGHEEPVEPVPPEGAVPEGGGSAGLFVPPQLSSA